MKKLLLCVWVLFVVGVSVSAQDLIVRMNNDTIYCKIQQMSEDDIQYQIRTEGMTESNTIPRRYVKSFFIAAEGEGEEEVPVWVAGKTERRFRLAFAAGYAARLGEILKTGDPRTDDLSKDLSRGIAVDVEAQMFLKEQWGVALNVNHVRASTEGAGVPIPGYGMAYQYKESQQITFIGPAFACRHNERKLQVTGSLGLGALIYRDKIIMDGMGFIGKATTVGLNFAVGAEYMFSPSMAGGLKLSETLGAINEMSVNGITGSFDGKLSLSTFMISAYLSFTSR